MTKNFVCILLGSTALLVGTTSSVLAQARFPAQCAVRDLQVVTSIEQAGDARQVLGDQLKVAVFTVLDARKACTQARVAEGLALYDIALPGSEVSAAGKN
jgi:hypothetical protein